jgi:hypothetical protein
MNELRDEARALTSALGAEDRPIELDRLIGVQSTPGQTAIVGGIRLAGCSGEQWQPALVKVTGASGNLIASQTVSAGQKFDIPIPAGTYNVAGFTTGGLGPFEAPVVVTVEAEHTAEVGIYEPGAA